MSKMLKVPSVIAEYTLGTMIVLFHLSVIRPLDERKRKREIPSKNTSRRAN